MLSGAKIEESSLATRGPRRRAGRSTPRVKRSCASAIKRPGHEPLRITIAAEIANAPSKDSSAGADEARSSGADATPA